jgi:Holliday junction DNA helicase RuvA
MIGRITGQLLEVSDSVALVDAGGIGYEVVLCTSARTTLPAPGGRVQFQTHLVVREDAHVLYGFESAAERDLFRLCIRINGVGPRLALALVSALPPRELGAAVAANDPSRLKGIPGIGKKTAERLLVELRDKLPAIPDPGPATVPTDASAEAERALVALGYKPAEAARVVASVRDELEQAGSTMDVVRAALKRIARQAEASA